MKLIIPFLALLLLYLLTPIEEEDFPVLKEKCTGYSIIVKDSIMTCDCKKVKYTYEPIRHGIHTNK